MYQNSVSLAEVLPRGLRVKMEQPLPPDEYEDLPEQPEEIEGDDYLDLTDDDAPDDSGWAPRYIDEVENE